MSENPLKAAHVKKLGEEQQLLSDELKDIGNKIESEEKKRGAMIITQEAMLKGAIDEGVRAHLKMKNVTNANFNEDESFKCPYGLCDDNIPISELERHFFSCVKRRYQCPICREPDFTYSREHEDLTIA